ncbi:MAG: DUF1156 domain-containing protein, partial [Bdellovibrionales bacterium]|nr:DUF1156 domain-containing protein [Bdellovibrionales bacterium]
MGLNTFASDLNPVAVSINKSILQYPSLFFGLKPIRPKEDGDLLLENDQINGTEGLAIDVDYYGNKLKEFVFESLQSHFPKVSIDDDLISKHPELSQLKGQDFTVASWLWARTVKSPSPAHSSSDVPLIKSFKISTKQGKEAWVKVNVEGSDFSFLVRNNSDFPEESGTMTKSGAKCIYSGASIPFKELRQAGKEKKIHQRLMAIVLEGTGGKLFISPTSHAEEAAIVPNVQDLPANSLPEKALGFRVQEYGMLKYTDLFSFFFLFMITKFSNSLPDIRKSILVDAVQAGMEDDGVGLEEGGTNATAYADLIVMYLGFIIDQVANHSSTLCGWNSANRQMRSVFARQTLSMNWDYAESNPFSNSSGSFANLLERQVKAIRGLGSLGDASAQIEQADASEQNLSLGKVISTDPPYYDNIAYADLSDFFYTWLRYSLKFRFPKLYSTIATPKMEELIANPYIRGGKKESELFFLEGMKKVLTKLALTANELYPVTIYYAFKQSETKNNLTSSTGWETFLEAVVQSGFYITGTWPLRTEKVGRVRGNSSNALASSIVLVCRKRDKDAQTCSRRQFIRELNKELPDSIAEMTVLNGSQLVAPVDLSQAIIGPGMSIFSKYKTVLEADGSSMSVSTALKLINRYISEDDFDNDTQFCIHWFETNGWEDGHFGDADILARAKGTSADRLRDGGIAESSSGVFKLIHWNKYEESWSLES